MEKETDTSKMLQPMIHKDEEYKAWIAGLVEQFRQGQVAAVIHVNRELLLFYWCLGRDINEMDMEHKYGKGIIHTISKDLQRKLPHIKGLTEKNIYYCKRWYSLYINEFQKFPQPVGKSLESLITASDIKLPQPVGESDGSGFPKVIAEFFSIPWSHHRYIIDKIDGNAAKGLFYVHQTFQHGWSRAVLLNWLDTDLYNRQGKAINNFDRTLPPADSDLARQMAKDPYVFDYTGMTEQYNEAMLKRSLVDHVEKTLMEMGPGFAFISREHHLMVGSTDKFVDLLFYQIPMHRYVAVEVKVDKFDSDNVGQLGLYQKAINEQMNTPVEKPSVGLLVCKEMDRILVQYSLDIVNQPMCVTTYTLSRTLPESYKNTLPEVEDIEANLNGLEGE